VVGQGLEARGGRGSHGEEEGVGERGLGGPEHWRLVHQFRRLRLPF
jgi:hypothetical protein